MNAAGTPAATAVPFRMLAVVFPTAAVIMGDSLIYVVLPASVAEFGIGDDFGMSRAFWLGLALSVNRFVRLVGNAVAAASYRRLGFRLPFFAATLLGAATTLSYGFSSGVVFLLAARALWGVAYSHLRLGAYLAAFEFGGSRTRGKLLGVFNSGQRAGSLVAVTGGAILADLTSRSVAFSVLAAFGLLGVIAAARAPSLRVRAPAGNAIRRRDSRAYRRDFVWDVLVSPVPKRAAGLRRRMLAISVLRFATAFAATGLVIATVSPFLAEVFSGGATVFGLGVRLVTLAGILVGFRWFANLALSVPLGHLSDTIGRRPTIIGGSGVMLAALGLLALAPSGEAVVVAMPALFVASVAVEVALDASMGGVAPPEIRPSAMARYTTWLDLGSATGPICGFLIADALGFGAGYLVAIAITVAGLAGYVLTVRRR